MNVAFAQKEKGQLHLSVSINLCSIYKNFVGIYCSNIHTRREEWVIEMASLLSTLFFWLFNYSVIKLRWRQLCLGCRPPGNPWSAPEGPGKENWQKCVPRLASAPLLQYFEEFTRKSSSSSSARTQCTSLYVQVVLCSPRTVGFEKSAWFNGILAYERAVQHSPLFGRDLSMRVSAPGSGSASRGWAPVRLTLPRRLSGSVPRELARIRMRADTQQSSSAVLPKHTRVSLPCSGRTPSLGSRLVLGFPLIPVHWHAMVKVVTNTVISNFYPVINANNRSSIPFSDHLSSNKGCN